MATPKRFQNHKINKDDHKDIKQVAGGVKKGVGLLGIALMAVPAIKKYGKEIPKIASAIIFKR